MRALQSDQFVIKGSAARRCRFFQVPAVCGFITVAGMQVTVAERNKDAHTNTRTQTHTLAEQQNSLLFSIPHTAIKFGY